MNVTVFPGALHGRVRVPVSKSYAHRLMIAAALSGSPVDGMPDAVSADLLATRDCLQALQTGGSVLNCRESASTLRFLLPVAAALGKHVCFAGEGRLPERPNTPLIAVLRAHGVSVAGEHLPFSIAGRLSGGDYRIAGDVSSQYVSGLLLALPLCSSDSTLTLTTPLVSAAYVDITLACLAQFGVEAEKTPTGYRIRGRQHYCAPAAVRVEGDWSAAAFWMTAAALGQDVRCTGLNVASLQGDRAIAVQLQQLGGVINVSDTPDAVPALAVAAALHPGVTRITHAARLRMKESDRLRAVREMLTVLGANCTETEDGLLIRGAARLQGGTVHGFGDHRIVMAAVIAATKAEAPVTVTGCEAVRKSYPAFFDDFTALGGKMHVEYPGE